MADEPPTRQDPEEWDDPLIDEVRAVRARLVEEAGGTIEGLFESLREVERQNEDRLVRHKPPLRRQPG